MWLRALASGWKYISTFLLGASVMHDVSDDDSEETKSFSLPGWAWLLIFLFVLYWILKLLGVNLFSPKMRSRFRRVRKRVRRTYKRRIRRPLRKRYRRIRRRNKLRY